MLISDVTVSQNDEGIWIPNTKDKRVLQPWDVNEFPNILVFSAGGFGHVPVPLMMGERPLRPLPQPTSQQFLMSFVGTAQHHPVREEMLRVVQHSGVPFLELHGPTWDRVYNESQLHLCPRGYGRSSFNLYETIQTGVVPIYVYDDVEWLPYKDLRDDFTFSVHVKDLGDRGQQPPDE